jgi:hypothetical protein
MRVPQPIISCEESLMSAVLVCNNKLIKKLSAEQKPDFKI